jgi:hypothetical protein
MPYLIRAYEIWHILTLFLRTFLRILHIFFLRSFMFQANGLYGFFIYHLRHLYGRNANFKSVA